MFFMNEERDREVVNRLTRVSGIFLNQDGFGVVSGRQSGAIIEEPLSPIAGIGVVGGQIAIAVHRDHKE